MPNNNPIRTTDNGQYPEFIIPKSFGAKKISVSITATLSKEKWELDMIHAMALTGKSLDFDPTADDMSADLDTGKKLNGKKFALASIATRIRNGGTPKAPKVTYTLQFSAGDEVVDQKFSLTSDETNPVTFYTKITFKLEA
ncbi:MAG: hypothetical protein U0X40_01825 [Ferruginibacter sp.]